ncbi:MAG: tRNA pseudouridine synthase D [Candidatus Tectimicrobiota bacterium]|nr:MAG: tRNA pseudouridine synthase D [Candidatus Tectomicrobia bacterium]
MKLKRLPEDFQVEELSDVAPQGGAFALYRLRKRSLGTPEAIAAIARRWRLPRRDIAYGGLKDRHALTTQFVTIRHGPRRSLRQTNLELVYLGQVARPFTPQDIRGNRFHLVLRDLSAAALARAEQALEEVKACGFPNYFDDQRFGSVGVSGEFVAQAWCRGDDERALWLALAEPNRHDRPREREQKRLLRQHWGDWARCQALLAPSHRRSIVSYLAAHPGDFRGAMARLRADLRGLYLAAWQSFLWNRLLAARLRQVCRPSQLVLVPLRVEAVPFYLTLDAAQRQALAALPLPLPSARLHLPPGPLQALLQQVLAELGLELRQLRLKSLREPFFAKGERAAVVFPGELAASHAPDELYPGRYRLTLDFTLPRGAYATLLVKRLTLAANRAAAPHSPREP